MLTITGCTANSSQSSDDDNEQLSMQVGFDAVEERFMRNALAWMKKEYGSVLGYIRDGLHISQTEIEKLKEKYLI